ncbi:MAG: type I 3-dehydroquinate dehydratase [Parasporobacterium sp.]|nr:type I 3-dehydroquinate dehydratase [Parasporobacterium sp.]
MSKVIRIKNLEIGQGRPKICALIIGDTEEEILDLARRSNDAACDMVEFRADIYEHVLDIDRLRELLVKIREIVRKPVLFTFRRFEEGGKVQVPLSYYAEILKMVAINSYAELVDVERSAVEDDASLIPMLKEMGVHIILSLHDFNSTPTQSEILKTLLTMQKMGPDIIKVAYMPNSKKDVLSLINATEEMTSNYSSCPVVAISMGHLGMITRILGEFIDSAISFASITRASAPGQVNIDNLEMVLNVIHDNYKRVFLIGFMGTGKTAVANCLANKYGLSKIDLDAYIEQKEHSSIADIYNIYSEEVFRSKETKYLRKIINKDYRVVSLGGGAVLKEENVQLIKEKGIIILLTANPETIVQRIKNDKTRPLIGDNMDLDYIRGLMSQRDQLYQNVADLVISTDDKTVEDICKEIVESLGFTL